MTRCNSQDIANVIETNATKEFYLTFKSSETWPLQPTTKEICRVLILDSSFNPPTKAHTSLLKTSLAHYPKNYFDATLLLLSTKNVDKQLTGASVLQRVEMMQLTAADYPHAAVGLTTHGKFVDKASCIQGCYPDIPLELYFIMGYDTITRLLDPKYYLPLPLMDALGPFLNQCHLICADRGKGDDAFWEKVNKEFGMNSIQRIKLDPVCARLSSTMARKMIQEGDKVSLRDVLCDPIIEFIDKNHVYI